MAVAAGPVELGGGLGEVRRPPFGEADHHLIAGGGWRVLVLLLRFAGFHRDDVRADRADGQGGGDPGDDMVVAVMAVQQQNLDQGAGAAAVAGGIPRRRPRTPHARR